MDFFDYITETQVYINMFSDKPETSMHKAFYSKQSLAQKVRYCPGTVLALCKGSKFFWGEDSFDTRLNSFRFCQR